jgi:Uncharacterized protein conserved in bacteria (DUF2330)
MKKSTLIKWVGAAAALWVTTQGAPANACGGFFCSLSQPVNQAAERIIFADNGDGTVTAVIQIQYQGPSESFSWLLPISTPPSEIKLASDQAFTTLQGATNPQYTLTTVVEGECEQESQTRFASADAAGVTNASGQSPGGGVQVAGSGSVGPFDWVVISVAEGSNDPTAEAVQWLEGNLYDVPEGARALLGPYLEDGLFLLALRLTKEADVGSIRPIVLTYEAERPIIPIKLTAVAANEDMGVLVWLLGEGRAVPENYLSLELNEARINWFNANSNYNSVVIEAADDAGGQGFVTELAGPTSALAQVIWSEFMADQWQELQSVEAPSTLFQSAFGLLGSFQGFWDAVEATATLPEQRTLDELKACPGCYSDGIQLDPSEFRAALQTQVVDPMRVVQDLIDASPKLTRLYTTLSAAEMTLDPLFTFNNQLPDVSNQHRATRTIECSPNITQAEATWRIELPQGGVVRGTPNQSNAQTWPAALDALPPNFSISRLAASGAGKELENNQTEIETALDEYNETVPRNEGDGCACGVVGARRNTMASAWLGVGLLLLAQRARRNSSGTRRSVA